MLLRYLVMALTGASALFATTAHGQTDGQSAVAMGNVVPGLMVTKQVKSLRDMRYNNMVRQERDFTCGAAALATILQQVYGRNIGEREIIEDMLRNTDEKIVRERGFSLLDMKNYVERIGLRGRGYKIDKNSLMALKIPVIALQTSRGYAHFVVIKRVHGGMVYIADPALGNRQMPLDEFGEAWNGIVFAVVGNGLKSQNELLHSAQSISASQRAGIVTHTLPPQQEFGLLGLDTF